MTTVVIITFSGSSERDGLRTAHPRRNSRYQLGARALARYPTGSKAHAAVDVREAAAATGWSRLEVAPAARMTDSEVVASLDFAPTRRGPCSRRRLRGRWAALAESFCDFREGRWSAWARVGVLGLLVWWWADEAESVALCHFGERGPGDVRCRHAVGFGEAFFDFCEEPLEAGRGDDDEQAGG